LPMGYVADRISRRMMIVFGGLLVAGGMIYFARSTSLADLVIASVLFGLGGGISMPAHMAIAVFKGNQSEAMGSLMGLMTMAHSLGMLLGSSLAGVMMDIAELRDAFSLGAAISFVGIIVFFGFTRTDALHLHKEDII
jgi:DHA1 family multidrug resistance protein-like MFS transporter